MDEVSEGSAGEPGEMLPKARFGGEDEYCGLLSPPGTTFSSAFAVVSWCCECGMATGAVVGVAGESQCSSSYKLGQNRDRIKLK